MGASCYLRLTTSSKEEIIPYHTIIEITNKTKQTVRAVVRYGGDTRRATAVAMAGRCILDRATGCMKRNVSTPPSLKYGTVISALGFSVVRRHRGIHIVGMPARRHKCTPALAVEVAVDKGENDADEDSEMSELDAATESSLHSYVAHSIHSKQLVVPTGLNLGLKELAIPVFRDANQRGLKMDRNLTVRL
eukprot:6209408-Pleurochrysis_carterae.AAC.1